MSTKLLKALEAQGVDVDETLERFMGDTEMYEKYLIRFLTEPSFQKLETAVETLDHKAGEEAIHALKGITDNLGFEDFVDAAVDMLYEFRHDNAEGAWNVFPEAKEEYNRICSIIRENME